MRFFVRKKLVLLLILFFFSLDEVNAQGKTIPAPLIQQMPELPRGCEVTSLAMLLNSQGIHADKMTLAKQVKKVPFSRNGFRGNPYDGFVGDIYSFSKPGLGVYHGPIFQLANTYAPGRVIDFTGSKQEQIYQMIDRGSPVWVITNSMFKQLNSSYFKNWKTSSGTVSITYKEHSVLVTGYDQHYVYVNDPLFNQKNRKLSRKDFEAAWIQMGRQAIGMVPKNGGFLAENAVENNLKQAISLAGSLKWEINIDYRKKMYPKQTLGLPDMVFFNKTKEYIMKTEDSLGKVNNAELKARLQKRLDEEVVVHFKRAQAYVDAISSGNRIVALSNKLEATLGKDPLSNEGVKLYHQLAYELKKNAGIIGRVYGKSTRETMQAGYQVPVGLVLEKHRNTVTAKMLLDKYRAAGKGSSVFADGVGVGPLKQLEGIIAQIPDAKTREIYMVEWRRLK